MIGAHRERGGIIWKLLVLVAVLLLLGVIYLLRRPLLTALADVLVVNEKLTPADAILVLGDDTFTGDRARHAAKLYSERWAPRVVASGRFIRPYASIADLIRRDLMQAGVPEAHIVLNSAHMTNTREEAFALREIIRRERWRRVIVVTSSYHTRRSRYIFRRALDPETELLVSAADDSTFVPNAWWESRNGLKIFLRESLAWPVAIWEMSGEQPASPAAPTAPVPAPARP